MIKQTNFFKWDDKKSPFEIKLGQNKNDLIEKKIIKPEKESDENIVYRGNLNSAFVTFDEYNKVRKIGYFKTESKKLSIKGIEIFNLPPQGHDSFFKSNYHITDIKDIEKLKKTHTGDFLCTISRDYQLSMIVITRLK